MIHRGYLVAGAAAVAAFAALLAGRREEATAAPIAPAVPTPPGTRPAPTPRPPPSERPTVPAPPPAPAPPGPEPASAFLARTARMSEATREREFLASIARGNVPSWTWSLVDVPGVGRVMPDFLALGTDQDFVRVPLTPSGAAAVLGPRGMRLPTQREAEAIFAAARARGGHVGFRAWSPHDGQGRGSNTALAEHHAATERARTGRTGLLDGHQKYVLGQVNRDGRAWVVIYGGWGTNGALVQPLFTHHAATYLDYSHGIRGVM